MSSIWPEILMTNATFVLKDGFLPLWCWRCCPSHTNMFWWGCWDRLVAFSLCRHVPGMDFQGWGFEPKLCRCCWTGERLGGVWRMRDLELHLASSHYNKFLRLQLGQKSLLRWQVGESYNLIMWQLWIANKGNLLEHKTLCVLQRPSHLSQRLKI